MAESHADDADGTELAPDGRVMEMLSEHTLEGWLEGYLLTGRHGFFSTYEAFAHVIDSMFNQHAKWLQIASHLPWRADLASLNLLITSTVWRQDHNGFTHQDPGFLDLVVNKSAAVTRIYLPPDANCLLSVADHCLRSRNYVNVIVADKQKHLQYLDMPSAIRHCTKGVGIWEWASTDGGQEPDVVMASAGDVPTKEALAASALLRQAFPDIKIRFINVHHLRSPRLPVADSPPGLPAHQPQEPARTWLQGKGQHQHAAGAGHPERGRQVQPGHRRHRSRPASTRHRCTRPRALPQHPARVPRACPCRGRGPACRVGLDLAVRGQVNQRDRGPRRGPHGLW
jgi:hypothetical protein